MKSIKQIRENFDLITEKEEKESNKLTALVRAGLYDAKKLPALKKALDKSADKMTGQEKRMLINLLDSLIAQVTSDEQVYRKVKQNVHTMNEAKEDYLSKFDPRFKPGYPSDKDIPTVLILKRKAIRVYPDNQKVALYYSQALDKYVTIPFSDIQTGLNEAKEDKDKKKRRSSGFNATEYFKKRNEKTRKKASDALNLLRDKGEYSSSSKRFSAVRKRVGTTGGALGVMIHDKFRKSAIKKALEKKKASRKITASETSTPKTEAPKAPVKEPVSKKAPEAKKPEAKPAVVPPKNRPVKEVIKRMEASPHIDFAKGTKKYVERETKKQVNESAEQSQLDEALPLAALGVAARVAAPYVARGAMAVGRGALSLGKRVLGKWKNKKASNKKKRVDLDVDANISAPAAGAASSAGQNHSQPSSRNYNLGQLKPKTGSSWENKADSQASQRMRDQRLYRQSQSAMLKENSVVSTLKSMIDNNVQEQTVTINEQEININNTVAKKIMLVYESVNKTNQKKMEQMLNESATSFNKVLTFALRQ